MNYIPWAVIAKWYAFALFVCPVLFIAALFPTWWLTLLLTRKARKGLHAAIWSKPGLNKICKWRDYYEDNHTSRR